MARALISSSGKGCGQVIIYGNPGTGYAHNTPQPDYTDKRLEIPLEKPTAKTKWKITVDYRVFYSMKRAADCIDTTIFKLQKTLDDGLEELNGYKIRREAYHADAD
jgi:hypothetical protein